MTLQTLGATHFRCFENASLSFKKINILTGENGSGKTSLLEAVFFLGRGRSFRTHRLSHLQQNNYNYTQVFGRAQACPIGIERRDGALRYRCNGENAHIDQLIQLLPTLVIEPRSHMLVEGGPKKRREFMDWGVFHVEHSFLKHWRHYRRLLHQRNALLKQQAPAVQLKAWEAPLVSSALEINNARRQWLSLFMQYLPTIAADLLPGVTLELDYKQGWPAQYDYHEALAHALKRDVVLGTTSVGPHRADLRINWNGYTAQDHVSRGQQKMLAITLLVTQSRVLEAASSQSAVFLVDDIAAELDREHLKKTLSVLEDTGAQLLLTGTDASALTQNITQPLKMFHVEQGGVQEVV